LYFYKHLHIVKTFQRDNNLNSQLYRIVFERYNKRLKNQFNIFTSLVVNDKRYQAQYADSSLGELGLGNVRIRKTNVVLKFSSKKIRFTLFR